MITEARALVVVEPAPLVRVLTDALSSDGIAVDEAADLGGALHALSSRTYDVVLLGADPLTSRHDVLREIRRQPSFDNLPVLMVSSEGESDVAAGLLAGATDCVTLASEPTVLRARVAAALRTRRALLGARDRALLDRLTDAAELQRGRLPRVPLTRRGISVAGEVCSLGRTSGDVFDVIEGRDGAVSVVLLDVAGHGVSAALVAASAREVLASTLRAGRELGEVVLNLEDALESYRDLMRASAALGIVRIAANRGRMEVLNAGLPPIVCAIEGASPSVHASRSMPAGFGAAAHPIDVVELACPGRQATVLLASDGATGGAQDESAVLALWESALHACPEGSAASLEPRALRELIHALAGPTLGDDASVVLLSFRVGGEP